MISDSLQSIITSAIIKRTVEDLDLRDYDENLLITIFTSCIDTLDPPARDAEPITFTVSRRTDLVQYFSVKFKVGIKVIAGTDHILTNSEAPVAKRRKIENLNIGDVLTGKVDANQDFFKSFLEENQIGLKAAKNNTLVIENNIVDIMVTSPDAYSIIVNLAIEKFPDTVRIVFVNCQLTLEAWQNVWEQLQLMKISQIGFEDCFLNSKMIRSLFSFFYFTRIGISRIKTCDSEFWKELSSGIKNHKALTSLSLKNLDNLDAELLLSLFKGIGKSSALQKLSICNLSMGSLPTINEALTAVFKKNQLYYLRLQDTNLPDEAITHLTSLLEERKKTNMKSVKNLYLKGNSFQTESALRLLQADTKLKVIDIRKTNVRNFEICQALKTKNRSLVFLYADSLNLDLTTIQLPETSGKNEEDDDYDFTIHFEELTDSKNQLTQFTELLSFQGTDLSYKKLVTSEENLYLEIEKKLEVYSASFDILKEIASIKNTDFREKLFIKFFEHKFNVHNVAKDGNCFFSSMAIVMNNKPMNDHELKQQAKYLRGAVVETIEKNSDDFAPYFFKGEDGESLNEQGEAKESLNEHCEKMKVQGKWAEHYELRAAVKYLNTTYNDYFFILHLYDLHSLNEQGFMQMEFANKVLTTLSEHTFSDGELGHNRQIRHLYMVRNKSPEHYQAMILKETANKSGLPIWIPAVTKQESVFDINLETLDNEQFIEVANNFFAVIN